MSAFTNVSICELRVPQVDPKTKERIEAIRSDFQVRFGYDKRLVPGDSLTLCEVYYCATYDLTVDGDGYFGSDRRAVLPAPDPRDIWQEPRRDGGPPFAGGSFGPGGQTGRRGSVTVGRPTPVKP